VEATREATTADRRWRRRERRGTAGLLAGPLLWLLLFFVIPVAFVAAYSVGAVGLFPTDTGVVSLSSWERLLTGGSVYMGLFWKSIRMSLTVSAVVVLVAYPVGYFLALCVGRRKYVLVLLIIAPFLTSYLLRVLAWKVILGDAGVINSFLEWTGVTDQPIDWLLYSQGGTAEERRRDRGCHAAIAGRSQPGRGSAADRSGMGHWPERPAG
jgi:spermidine/putrescine transport system permease protein